VDKKSIIVVTLCVVLMLLWGPITHLIFPPKPKTVSKLSATSENAQAADNALDNIPLPSAAEKSPDKIWGTSKVPPVKSNKTARPPESPKISVIENAQLRIELSNIGGGVQRFILKEHFNHHLDNDSTDNVVINCQYANKDGLQIPGFVLIGINDLSPETIFSTTDASDEVVYETTTPAGINIRKTYNLSRESDYGPILLIEINNNSGKSLSLKKVFMTMGTIGPLTTTESAAYIGFDLFEKPSVIRKHYDTVKKEPFESNNPLSWVAIKNQFFTLIVQPYQFPASGFYAESISTPEKPNTFAALLGVGDQTIASGESISLEYKIYAGPKEFKRLRELGDNKDQVMAFDVFMGMTLKIFGYITQMLLAILIYINSYVHNFGLAIVIITVFIKIIYWPLTGHATNSMKKMAALQPRLTTIRDKYKDNPQKLQQEMMKMYREYKVNPFSGCLPGLLQFPVFLAFYSMLQSAIELRGAKFLWIKDLSQPDTIFHLFNVSWLPVNPMPLIMAASMFVQMQMTPMSGDPAQKKIFMFMPVIFLVFCYNFSSGLSLYWTVQNLVTILQTWLSLRKKDPLFEKLQSSK